jgi:hypothetical protein
MPHVFMASSGVTPCLSVIRLFYRVVTQTPKGKYLASSHSPSPHGLCQRPLVEGLFWPVLACLILSIALYNLCTLFRVINLSRPDPHGIQLTVTPLAQLTVFAHDRNAKVVPPEMMESITGVLVLWSALVKVSNLVSSSSNC